MLNFYLYAVTAISLGAAYLAALTVASGLLRLALGMDTDMAARQAVATGVGIVMTAAPLWWVHWRWLRQQFERACPGDVSFHRFYLFTVVCVNAMAILVSGSIAMTRFMGLILELGVGPRTELADAGLACFALGLSLALWLHHWRQFRGGRGELLPRIGADQELAEARG